MSYALRQNPANAANFTPGREGNKIAMIVIHHADTTDFNGIGATFANPNRGASAHYGVGQNNNVDQYVAEGDTAWHANDWPVNQKSIGIENVNLTLAPDFQVADSTFATLVELCRDIAARNGLLPLKVGKTLSLAGHKDVGDAPTDCPGVLEARLQELADAVNGDAAAVAVRLPTVIDTNNTPDQVLSIGSHFVFGGPYRVDAMEEIGGVWQVQTNALCPRDFTWPDNGIPVGPLTEVAGGVGPVDQVLQVGSEYTIPGTYTVLNLGFSDGMWLAEVDAQGWKFWVDVTTVTEV